MKRINKYISLAVVALFSGAIVASCDDSKDNDFVQEYDGPSGVYFSNTESAYLELDSASNTVTYPVYRDVAGPELTVAIEVTPVENYTVKNIYTFPETVTFPAGSKVADLVIGYDISKATIGMEQQYEVTLDAESTPFASNSVIITLVNPVPWILLGTNGKYYDYFWGVTEDYAPGPVSVSVWQDSLNKNHYRISNPYYALNEEDTYFEFYIMNQGDIYFGQTIQYDGLVGYDTYYIEYISELNGDFYIYFPVNFVGFDDQSTWVYNRVVQYQENGMPGYIVLSPIYYVPDTGDGYNMASNEPIEIIFPDFEVLDTTLEVTYEGVLTPTEQIQQVLLSVDLGADITSARAAVTQGTNGNALIQAIENETVAFTTFNNSGNVKINFGNENPTGQYTAAVVAYVGDEVKASKTVSFFYVSSSTDFNPNEGWKSLGYADYTDAFVCSCPILFLPDPIQTYSVEIQESEEQAGLYRLVNPYGKAYPYSDIEEDNPYLSYYLYIDATNPTRVKILESEQDLKLYLDDGYGNVTLGAQMTECWSTADYYETEEGISPDEIAELGRYYGTLANGKITFPNAFTYDYQGQTYLSSGLMAGWVFPDYPGDEGLYTANVVMDYNTYVSSNYQDLYLMTPMGTFYNPFMLDMSKLTSEANYRINGQVMLTKRGIELPGMKKFTTSSKVVKNPNLKKTEKKSQKISEKTISPMQITVKRIK